ncbi:hypothetical protein BO71DRAFT_394986 [Aspergillus ellipticus CBS 707.79]|uniref:Uncharacterized protein n=1 Tax=Aspergillus ellipticus CBS 707.79 TaxID=1448320 RepID=A0A319DMK5_9EURO|nr:hypothetical protein BO71DRAFT_394986 [Aspergillus ellipticus CBS 707.79]
MLKRETYTYHASHTDGQKEKTKRKCLSSDRGNRTPGCRVRDGDVSHYTISDGYGGA